LDKNKKIARIKWACRRGMLELDFMLTEFLSDGFHKLSDEQIESFEEFLHNADPDLYAWLMGYQKPKLNKDIEMVNLIKNTVNQ